MDEQDTVPTVQEVTTVVGEIFVSTTSSIYVKTIILCDLSTGYSKKKFPTVSNIQISNFLTSKGPHAVVTLYSPSLAHWASACSFW